MFKPSRTTKIVAAAMAASALASTLLPSDGFTPSLSGHPVFRQVAPGTTSTTSLNYLDSTPPAHLVAPPLSPEELHQRQMEANMWTQIHAYLVSTYQDYREWDDIVANPSEEEDLRKFGLEPKALLAQVTYRYSEASQDIKDAMDRDYPQVISEWKDAVGRYYALLLQAQSQQPIHAMVSMSIMSMLYLNSKEVLSKLRNQYGGTFDSQEPIHPQQWLQVQERFQHIFKVDQIRQGQPTLLRSYGNRISPLWNVRAPAFTKSLVADANFKPILERYNTLAKALISGQPLSPEQMIEHDFLMTKLVFLGEPWLNAQKEQKVARFDAQDYTKKTKATSEEPNVFRFDSIDYDAARTTKSSPKSPSTILTFDQETSK